MQRILIVGVGSIGERHVRCFLATGRVTVGICELNNELRESVATRYDVAYGTGDLAEALAQPWDGVLIATPAHTHIPIASQAVDAGLDIVIEKPLSISLEGVESLRRRVREQGLMAAVSYQIRAHPGTATLKAALDGGQYGKPLQVLGSIGQYFPKYRPAYGEVYFADPAQGGGAIHDAMTHLLNLGEYLVGPITRLVADADHQHLAGVTVEDTVHVIARHDQIMANYTLNLYQKPNESHITIVCEHATLRFELHQSRWRVMAEPEGPWEDHDHPLADRDALYIANATHLLDALAGTAKPLCSLAEGIQTLHVNLAVHESVRSGSWQEIVPD